MAVSIERIQTATPEEDFHSLILNTPNLTDEQVRLTFTLIQESNERGKHDKRERTIDRHIFGNAVLTDIDRIKLLNSGIDEKIISRCNTAEEIIAMHFYKFIFSYARKARLPKTFDSMDMFEELVFVLMKRIRDYDMNRKGEDGKNATFIGYLKRYINFDISRINNKYEEGGGIGAQEDAAFLLGFRKEFIENNKKEPNEIDLINALNEHFKERDKKPDIMTIIDLYKSRLNPVTIQSLNMPDITHPDESSLEERISSDEYNAFETADEVLERLITQEAAMILLKMINKDAELIMLKYGIGCQELNLNEIGERYGISHQAISQKINNRLKRLATKLKEKGITEESI